MQGDRAAGKVHMYCKIKQYYNFGQLQPFLQPVLCCRMQGQGLGQPMVLLISHYSLLTASSEIAGGKMGDGCLTNSRAVTAKWTGTK